MQRRATIAISIFLCCCLLSSGRLIIDAARVKDSPDTVARRSDQRYSALKSALPGRGVIGYIGEPGTSALADYYLAQYALAPLVVDQSPNHAQVMGNFPSAQPAPAPPNLRLVQDFGNGVLLFTAQDAQ
jgi:hypothetical protein